MPVKIINDQRGVSIYLAILIMSILLAIVFGIDAILIGQMRTIRQIGYSVTAFYAAETGIEMALNDPECTTTCPSIPANQELNLGGGRKAYYTIYGREPLGTNGCIATASYCVISVGSYEGVKRAIQITR